jgi:hypothetical protein
MATICVIRITSTTNRYGQSSFLELHHVPMSPSNETMMTEAADTIMRSRNPLVKKEDQALLELVRVTALTPITNPRSERKESMVRS